MDFSGEGEIGLAFVSGNTNTSRTFLRAQSVYRWSEETVQVLGRYLHSSANEVQNAKSWSVGARYERRLVPRLGGFVGEFLEADRFAGFRQRYSSDVGLRKTLWREPRTGGAAELGYRYQIENRSRTRTTGHILRAFGETSYNVHANLVAVWTFEYLPNFRDTKDWMANSDLSIWNPITDRFLLKVTYGYRYDNRPAGPKRIDTSFHTSLVAKF